VEHFPADFRRNEIKNIIGGLKVGAIFGILGAVLLVMAILDFDMRGHGLLDILFRDNPTYRQFTRIVNGLCGVGLIVLGLFVQFS